MSNGSKAHLSSNGSFKVTFVVSGGINDFSRELLVHLFLDISTLRIAEDIFTLLATCQIEEQ